jgi:hypothetical protein
VPGNEPLPNLAELLATNLNEYFSQLMLSYQQRLYAKRERQFQGLLSAGQEF